MNASVNDRPLVIKFGGTSVGGGAEFVRAARITAEAAQDRPVAVVVSAMSGATDALLGLGDATASRADRISTGAAREGSIEELHRALLDRHLGAAREAVPAERLPRVEERLLALLKDLVRVVNEPAPHAARNAARNAARRAGIAVFGERLSAEILAGAIGGLGEPAAVVTEDPIATDSYFDEAEVDPAETRRRCSRHVAPLLGEGVVPVVPGYVGRSPEGSVTTLGRGGSDLSATVLGRALGSGEVWIMTDVDGVLSADPRLVPDAAPLPRLSYREAGVFAGLGAKVLHPKTMEPASETGMEVLVRNTFDPEAVGTRVSSFDPGTGVRCIALRRDVAVEIPCADGRESRAAMAVCIGSPDDGDLARGRRCLREAGIPTLHVGIAAAGLVFVVSAEAAEKALRALHAGLITPPRNFAGEEVA